MATQGLGGLTRQEKTLTTDAATRRYTLNLQSLLTHQHPWPGCTQAQNPVPTEADPLPPWTSRLSPAEREQGSAWGRKKGLSIASPAQPGIKLRPGG